MADTKEPTVPTGQDLVGRGVLFPGEEPDTTEFSGALFDPEGQSPARTVQAMFPFLLAPKTRGRPPKDARAFLALLAAFKVHLRAQEADGRPAKKGLAYEALGYAGERAARAALKTARDRLKRLLPAGAWTADFLPNDQTGHLSNGADLPDLGGRGLLGAWIHGAGDTWRPGQRWTGRAVCRIRARWLRAAQRSGGGALDRRRKPLRGLHILG